MATEVFKLVGRLALDGQQAVEKALDNVSKKAKGANDKLSNFGRGMQRFGDGAQTVGRNLTKYVTAPAVAAASALGGIALVKGFDRLIGIDTAQAKLKALGHDANGVKDIMNSALDSVRGTAFGLDEAATVAASAVAAGVEPGQQLTKYLTLTGDAAAVAGTSMGEMGSIFNKVETAQRAYTGELNQLADRGIPIYQWLAKEAGVTAEDIRDMASEGAISSEMFLKAVENNIGGAAKTIGEESFKAGLANIWASVGRIGANFLDAGGEADGFFSKIKPLLAEFRGYMELLEPKAAELGRKFGEAFETFIQKIRDAKAWFESLAPPVQDIIVKVGAIGAAVSVGIGPAIMIVGMFASAIGAIATVIGMVGIATIGWIALIAAIGVALVALYVKFEPFREIVNKVFSAIWEIIQQVMESVVGFIQEQLARIKAFWDENGEQIMQAVTNLFNFIKAVIEFVMPFIVAFIQQAWENIKGAISAAIDIILGVIKFFSSVLTGDWAGAWQAVKDILSGAVQLIWNLINLWFLGRIMGIVRSLGTGIINLIRGSFNTVIGIFKSLGTSAYSIVMKMVSNVLGLFRSFRQMGLNIFQSIRGTIEVIWQALQQAILRLATRIYTGVQSQFNNVLTTARNIFNKVRDAIMNPVNKARDGVKTAIDKIKGFFSGLKLQLPKIKLPHFKLSGEFSLAPPKVPKLSVDWYKKGGVFGGPSIIGVGEEPGVSEAVIPLKQSVLSQIGEGIAQARTQDNNNYSDSGNNQPLLIQLMLDKKVLVTELVDPMDRELGLRKRRRRG